MVQATLRDQLTEHFNESELQNLCFDLDVRHENLPGNTHQDKARELIAYCQRYGRLEDLVNQCQKLRPHVIWAIEPVPKPDFAPGHTNQGGKSVSFPQIIVGILAVIGLVAILFYIIQLLQPTPTSPFSPAASRTTTGPIASNGTALPDALPDAACFDQFFLGIPNDRLKILEDGVDDLVLVESDQSQEDEIGILFTAFNQPVGAMRFIPFPHNNMFKIISVVDSTCQEVEQYADFDDGADGIVDNGVDVSLRLGTAVEYYFSIYYYQHAQEENIKASFWQLSP